VQASMGADPGRGYHELRVSHKLLVFPAAVIVVLRVFILF
jgi:hypothetical protein